METKEEAFIQLMIKTAEKEEFIPKELEDRMESENLYALDYSEVESVILASHCDEINEDELHEYYDQMLDECNTVEVNGEPLPNFKYSEHMASEDPVTYRCGFSDWLDSAREMFHYDEIRDKYYHEQSARDVLSNWGF